jgi:ACS family hexuronate transporter-like MFS transporter
MRTPSDASACRRWTILSILFLVTVINFIDRQTLSILAPVLRAALHLSNEQYGRIVSAFQFGMLSGEFPMGYLMDRWGARLGLSFAVLWWSAATGAQVFARDGVQFGIFRYWMGTGECGNYPPAPTPAAIARRGSVKEQSESPHVAGGCLSPIAQAFP